MRGLLVLGLDSSKEMSSKFTHKEIKRHSLHQCKNSELHLKNLQSKGRWSVSVFDLNGLIFKMKLNHGKKKKEVNKMF